MSENSLIRPLAELPVGTKATIVKIMPRSRGQKKFADIGIVPGTELLIEAHAPFGGLIRVRVMDRSVLNDKSGENAMYDTYFFINLQAGCNSLF